MNNKKNNSWYNKQTFAQNARLNDLVDWVDDDTMDDATEVLSPNVVDYDALETQRALNAPIEQGDLPFISEEEIDSYLVDDFIEQDENVLTDDEVEEGYFDGSYVPSEDELQELGIEPVEDTGEVVDEIPDDVPDFGGNNESALQWAIENNRVVKLSYLTLGKKRGRGGKRYLKREITDDRIPGTGRNIWRIVEPHHIFSAKNGHEVLVTYDRSVRHIRAFRLKNVTDVEFVKKRQTNEPSYFKPRVKIKSPGRLDQSGKIKGIESMNNNIFQNLKSIGDDLESKGLSKTASVITSTMSNLLNIKTAQYVGPQGYWIRQKRCWDNCYRQKRTTAPEKAAQVVWTECWEEYNKAINNNKSGWEKYAQEDVDLFKYASDEQKDWVSVENKKFAKAVENKVASGESQGMAIYKTLDEKQSEYSDTLLADVDNLSKLAEQLKANGQDELSDKLANASIEILKEAQFDRNFSNWGNKARKFNPFSSKSRAKGRSGDIVNRIKRITQQALQMANKFNTIKQQARQSGQEEVGYQQQQAQRYQQQQAKQQGRADMMNKVKSAPGQVFNWAKDKGQQFVNPGPNTAQIRSHSDIKTAQNTPAFQTGMDEFASQLRDEFQMFMENIRKEATAMGQMATQESDPQSQQRAQQIAQRMMQFSQKATPFEQAFYKKNEMAYQSDALVQELQSFANDVNMIQIGQYDPNAVVDEEPAKMDVDGDGDIDEQDVALEQAMPTEQPVAQEPQAVDLEPIRQQIAQGTPLDEVSFNSLKSQVMQAREAKARLDEISALYGKAVDLKSKATRAKNRTV